MKSTENLILVQKLLIVLAVIMDFVNGVRGIDFINEIKRMKQVDKRWRI